MALPTAHTAKHEDIGLGRYEVKTADLAEIVGVSASTIHKWVKDDVTAPQREDYFGGGRPGLVFHLHNVVSDLSVEPTKEKYLPLLRAEIAKRALAEGEVEWEQGTLDEALEHLAEQGLVEEVPQAGPPPLPEILIEVLRHDLQQAHADLKTTQTALAKTVRLGGDDTTPVFSFRESAAIHNAIVVLDSEGDEQ